MDLFGSIPQWVWTIAVIAFAAWYVFGRGKKSDLKTLKKLKRQEESSKRRLNIARTEEEIAEIEQKKRKKKSEDLFKW